MAPAARPRLQEQPFGGQFFDTLDHLGRMHSQSFGNVVQRTGPAAQQVENVLSGHGRLRRSLRVAESADYLGRHFNLPVKISSDLPLSVIPAKARRTHPTRGDKQILSTYVLDDVLRPRMPKDAFGMIALTTSDLWPGKGWNFVFGQASLRERVGVWSMYRYGDPDKGRRELRRVLLRTIKTASHELGHMMSMMHCTAFECSMCGSNSRGESDRRPLALCPECMAKVCWATGAEPVERYRKLAAFCRTHGLSREAGRFGQFIRALQPAPTTTRAAN